MNQMGTNSIIHLGHESRRRDKCNLGQVLGIFRLCTCLPLNTYCFVPQKTCLSFRSDWVLAVCAGPSLWPRAIHPHGFMWDSLLDSEVDSKQVATQPIKGHQARFLSKCSRFFMRGASEIPPTNSLFVIRVCAILGSRLTLED